jgi:hypothetical protein
VRPRAEAVARVAGRRQGAPEPDIRHEQVQEAGPRHLDAVERVAEALAHDLAEPLGDRARRVPDDRGDQHRRVRGEVAEVGLGRAVELRLGAHVLAGDGASGGEYLAAQRGLGISNHRF